MSALSLDSAKNIAIVVAVVMVVLAVLSAMVVKNIVGKIISIVLLAGLALGVWTQRTNLQDCADKAQAEIEAKGPNATLTCTFFGQEIKVP